jgi:ABC-type sugar transport system substrate-binding protein
VGVKLALAAALCALAAAPSAFAQKSTDDGLKDCERLAAIKLKQENPAFKKFEIARAEAQEDKFADKVGTQFVSTVYHGKAVYQAGGEPADVRFICLHGGLGKGAVFVYTLPR